MFLDLGEVALSRGSPLCPDRALPFCFPRARDPCPRAGSDLCLWTSVLQDAES